MNSAGDRIATAKAEYRGLRAYLKGLAPGGWNLPSACRGWEVRDVVAHLMSTADFQARMVQRGLRGESGAPDTHQGTTVKSRSEAIAHHAIEERKKLGPDLLTHFDDNYRRLFSLLESLDVGQLDMPAYHPIGPGNEVKVRTYIDLVVLETSLHGWDIRWAGDRAAQLTPESIPVLMEYRQAWLARIMHSEQERDTSYRFRFQARGAGTQDLTVDSDGIRTGPPAASAPIATLTSDLDTHLLLCFGRLTFGQAVDAGRLAVEGGSGVIAMLDGWIVGV